MTQSSNRLGSELVTVISAAAGAAGGCGRCLHGAGRRILRGEGRAAREPDGEHPGGLLDRVVPTGPAHLPIKDGGRRPDGTGSIRASFGKVVKSPSFIRPVPLPLLDAIPLVCVFQKLLVMVLLVELPISPPLKLPAGLTEPMA